MTITDFWQDIKSPPDREETIIMKFERGICLIHYPVKFSWERTVQIHETLDRGKAVAWAYTSSLPEVKK